MAGLLKYSAHMCPETIHIELGNNYWKQKVTGKKMK